MFPPFLAAFAATLVLSVQAVPAGAAPSDPLGRYRWSARLLVASAAEPDDARLAEQRQVFAAMRDEARERDLVLVEAVGTGAPARAIRAELGITTGAFTVVLVGKDGGAKLRAAHVLRPGDLFPVIDAMPMRQDEMRR